jgi:DNA-binding XRE family transcriptional regulator
MRNRYLRFRKRYDDQTSSWGVIGLDSDRRDFGVGVGATVDEATQRLRDWVLDSLVASAGDGEDRLSDLEDGRPKRGDSIAFSPLELLPVRLRVLRTQHRLSQAQVAERLGMTQQGYAKLEKPGSNPELKTLLQVEAALEDELIALV